MEVKECQYCLSEIPSRAQKCKFCQEWQEIKFEEKRVNQTDNNYEIILKEPFQLSIIKWIPLHYTVAIFVVSVLIFAAIQLSWYMLDEEKIYLFTFLAYTLQMIIVWAALIWIYNTIKNNFLKLIQISSMDMAQMQLKLFKYQDLIFNTRNSLLFGVIIGLIAAVGDFILGTPFSSMEAKLLYAAFQFLTMVFAGAALYSMVIFSLFIYSISSDNNLKVIEPAQRNSISFVGAVHLKSSIIAIVPFFLGVIAKLFGDWNWEILIVLWYASFAVLIVVYIYWPMNNVHKLMKIDVDSQVFKVRVKIEKKLKELDSYPSSRNFMKLTELKDLENKLSSQNTWPFDLKSISAAFVAIIFPILLIIVDKIWSI